MTENFVQVWIMFWSGASALFLSRNDRARRFGFWCSLVGQPMWFYTAITHGQWGVAVLSVYFAFCGLRGIWTHRN